MIKSCENYILCLKNLNLKFTDLRNEKRKYLKKKFILNHKDNFQFQCII